MRASARIPDTGKITQSDSHDAASKPPESASVHPSDSLAARAMAGAPESVERHLSSPGLRAPILQRVQRDYGNRASQQIVMRAQHRNAPQSEDTVDLDPSGPRQLLEQPLRAGLEAHFQADLSGVRIHSGPEAGQSAASIDALAYTSGRDVYFAPGKYAPSSRDGQRLLAHEVAHVVQQGSGREPAVAAKSAHNVKIGPPDDPLETEAERAADGFMNGQPSDLTDEEQRKRRQPAPSVQRYIQRQAAAGQAKDWQDQLNELFPHGGLITAMSRVQTLQDLFGEELPALVGAIYADTGARQFVQERGLTAVLAMGETSPAHAAIDVPRARAWLVANPNRYASKNIGDVKRERSALFPDVPGVAKLSFDDALREGAGLLGKAQFGLSAGTAHGVDASDGYDARDWEEGVKRGVLVSKVEPWMAINSLVKNIGVPVPKAGGGTTMWSFDCFDFVTVLRIYAYWRTLSRIEFNTKFGHLELGFFGQSPMQWQQPIEATRPGEKPFKSGGTEVVPGTMNFREVRIPVGQSWRQLLDSAPVGTQITWANQDAKIKCTKDPSLSFCPYMYENTTKLGQDSYAAHPMGVVNEQTVKDEMAKAVFEGHAVPSGYIGKNIFISGMRIPIR